MTLHEWRMTLHDPFDCDACERMREYVRAGQLTCIHAMEADGTCELCTLTAKEIATLAVKKGVK